MKQKNFFYYALACVLFVCITTACEQDDKIRIEDEIPVAIKDDFFKRHPSAEVTSVSPYREGNHYRIDFIDKQRNEASASYTNETWVMTYTLYNDFGQLPYRVQKSFIQAGYGDVQEFWKIHKTEYAGIEKAVYDIHFIYPYKNSDRMSHDVLINEYGEILEVLHCGLMDPRYLVHKLDGHFNFIAERYEGAEVLGCVHPGDYKYYIRHDETIKHVYFDGQETTDRHFWQEPKDPHSWIETRYELSKNAKIPDNVIQALKREYPNLAYTNIYYSEYPEDNGYWFIDEARENAFGCRIPENVK